MATITEDRIFALKRFLARCEDTLDNSVSIHHEQRLQETITQIRQELDNLEREA